MQPKLRKRRITLSARSFVSDCSFATRSTDSLATLDLLTEKNRRQRKTSKGTTRPSTAAGLILPNPNSASSPPNASTAACGLKKKPPRVCGDLYLRAKLTSSQARESRDNPRLNAFCQVAPSVRFSVRAILAARVFFLAAAFSVRTSDSVHPRRFVFLAIQTSPNSGRKGRLVTEARSKANRKFAQEKCLDFVPLSSHSGRAARAPNKFDAVRHCRSRSGAQIVMGDKGQKEQTPDLFFDEEAGEFSEPFAQVSPGQTGF